ncbi:hypothetical protein [Nostoc sp. ATCC 53789]|nr:hypothetical protein [Nostoc sp. ATCC 53789]QHG18574.1 hypothetical protein GJB62_23060 [Nostoc sp. ATCC 53789]
MQTPTPRYDLLRVFALFSSAREMYEILQILKRIAKAMCTTDFANAPVL